MQNLLYFNFYQKLGQNRFIFQRGIETGGGVEAKEEKPEKKEEKYTMPGDLDRAKIKKQLEGINQKIKEKASQLPEINKQLKKLENDKMDAKVKDDFEEADKIDLKMSGLRADLSELKHEIYELKEKRGELIFQDTFLEFKEDLSRFSPETQELILLKVLRSKLPKEDYPNDAAILELMRKQKK